MSGGGDTRVSIPNNVRKVIQEIKKTLGSKHSEEFVYTTLKDSDMDPNEAGRRLKMIHGIIEIAGEHSVEDVYTMLKDCNMDPDEAAQRLLYIDTFHEVKKKHDRRKTISSDTSEEYKWTRGNQWRGAKVGRGTFYSSNVFDDVGGGRHLSSGKEYGVTNRQERVLKLTVPVHSGKENNVAHIANSAANVIGKLAITNGSYNYKLEAPEVSADVSSSTSDPVLVPSNHTCAVGSIKCEIVKRSCPSESNGRPPVGMKFGTDKVVASVVAEAADSDDTMQPNSDVVEKNPISESLSPISLSTQNSSQVVNPNQDSHPQVLNDCLKVTASEHATVSITSIQLVPGEESELKQSAPKLDAVLEKLTLSSHQPVIFPDHILVPDNFVGQFTFGSLDSTPDDCNEIESTQQIGEVVTQPSSSIQNVATTAGEGEFQDRPLPHLSEHVLSSQDNISSDPALKHDQKKLEMMPPIGGFQQPVLQNTRDYTIGFMPHLLGPHFVHVDVPELQSESSLIASALGPTPPTTAAQSTIALSPPLFPYFRQPYPNYIPYNPYFPHMYLPQNSHLVNHGVFPQQPPTGNVHMQAAAGPKFPVPSQYKQGSNAGSLNHIGTYGSSVGYGATVTPGSSANEDLTMSQSKENSLHSAAQQGDDPQVWNRDVLPNYFYNFPQGQHMAFSPLQAGLYHSSQTMTAQSHTTGGTVDSMVPPSNSYRQPQQAAQINWNATLLSRETS